MCGWSDHPWLSQDMRIDFLSAAIISHFHTITGSREVMFHICARLWVAMTWSTVKVLLHGYARVAGNQWSEYTLARRSLYNCSGDSCRLMGNLKKLYLISCLQQASSNVLSYSLVLLIFYLYINFFPWNIEWNSKEYNSLTDCVNNNLILHDVHRHFTDLDKKGCLTNVHYPLFRFSATHICHAKPLFQNYDSVENSMWPFPSLYRQRDS